MHFCSGINNRSLRRVRQAGCLAGFPCICNRERFSSPSSGAHAPRIKPESLDTFESLRTRSLGDTKKKRPRFPPPGSLLQEEEDVFPPPGSRQTLPPSLMAQ